MAKVNQNFIVYALFSSEKPTEIRYIGQAVDLKKRIYNHSHSARKGQQQPVYDWMRSIKKAGFKVLIRVLVKNAIYNQTEQQMIRKYKPTGLLLNLTDGGEGALGRTLSEETRKKISIANSGKKRSPEVIENYRKWRSTFSTGKRSEESKKKMRDAKLGKTSWAKGMTNRWSDEEKKRIGQQSRERIQKNGHPMQGRKVSEETKRKIANSLRARAGGAHGY